jgi:hypothetical protein
MMTTMRLPMLSETRERFANAIIAQVPIDRIVEIHFFQPIKQGGTESGVAVLAAIPDAPLDASQPEEPQRAPDDCVVIPAHSVEPPELEVPIALHGDVVSPFLLDADAPDEPQPTPRAEPEEAADDAYPPDDEPEARQDDDRKRFVVYTARYRLVLKGIDRGKWEASVVAEADAPLATVDAVVRGVLRRAGDAEDAERMTGEELRAHLAAVARS